jgi:hypothetical protein
MKAVKGFERRSIMSFMSKAIEAAMWQIDNSIEMGKNR